MLRPRESPTSKFSWVSMLSNSKTILFRFNIVVTGQEPAGDDLLTILLPTRMDTIAVLDMNAVKKCVCRLHSTCEEVIFAFEIPCLLLEARYQDWRAVLLCLQKSFRNTGKGGSWRDIDLGSLSVHGAKQRMGRVQLFKIKSKILTHTGETSSSRAIRFSTRLQSLRRFQGWLRVPQSQSAAKAMPEQTILVLVGHQPP